MVTIIFLCIVITSIGGIILIYNNGDIKFDIGGIAIIVGLVVMIGGPFLSEFISESKIPESYTKLERASFIVYDGENYWKESEAFFAKHLWIPGSAVVLEPCDPPEDFCVDCQEFQFGNFCEYCGKQIKQLSDCCPNCGAEGENSYCWQCGAKIKEEEK